MTWSILYPWLVTLHVLSAFAFMAIHGVSMAVWWRARRERDRTRLAAWLELSAGFIAPMLLAGLLLIASGVVVGIAGGWWFDGRWWLLASIGLLVVIVAVMTPMLSIPFAKARRGLGISHHASLGTDTVPVPIGDAELDELLSDRRPIVGAAIAIVGIVLITWLMETKPF